ncbi:hypothetical protein [Sodaliphilus sp.]|uniref:hypothetical protein n=1 Tax=Sodaliphilus sp. TaxID=2815818 RepID=UPI00388EBF1D
MPFPNMTEVARVDLFTAEDELRSRYPDVLVERILRVRDMYLWSTANPEAKDRQFIETDVGRYGISRVTAYADLAVVKTLLPTISTSSRDYHRWRYNEMIVETYQMAKKRKDTKTMERAASSYAKYNRIDVEDETAVPYDVIVVQPFTATSDPSVLGIKPIPNIQDKIQAMLKKYRAESMDIEDVEFEEADLELDTLFDNTTESNE